MEEAFLQVTDAIRKLPDPMQQVAVGVKLMGRGFTETLPAVRDGLREITDGAAKMSEETVRRADAAGDAWVELKNKIVVVSGEMIAKGFGALSDAGKKWEEAGFFGKLAEFGPTGALLMSLADKTGLLKIATTEYSAAAKTRR